MKLALNSDAWRAIYPNLRDEFYKLNPNGPNGRTHIKEFLEEQGIKIKTDPNWGIWEEVEIVLDDEELTIFLLTWA
jgi:hypothetical protein